MTRLENVIEQVKSARKGSNRPWIFDDNGRVKDNVLTCEVLDILEELKEYEIEVTDEWIDNFRCNPKTEGFNTYNHNGCISNDLNINFLTADSGEQIALIMVHLFGYIRGGYSDYFVVMFDDDYAFYELESTRQSKMITNTLAVDMCIFYEGYEVYDYEKNDYIGCYYEVETEDLLKEIANNN